MGHKKTTPPSNSKETEAEEEQYSIDGAEFTLEQLQASYLKVKSLTYEQLAELYNYVKVRAAVDARYVSDKNKDLFTKEGIIDFFSSPSRIPQKQSEATCAIVKHLINPGETDTGKKCYHILGLNHLDKYKQTFDYHSD